MALVDPALLEKLKGNTQDVVTKNTTLDVKTESPEVTLPPSAGAQARTNPFLRNVDEKRLIGLRTFLNRIIKDKPSPKYSYRRLKKYNEALASLIRLRKRAPKTYAAEVSAVRGGNYILYFNLDLFVRGELYVTSGHFCIFQPLENATAKKTQLEKQYFSDDDTNSDDYFTEESEDEEDESKNEEYEDQRPPLDENALRLAPKSVQDRVNSLTSHIEEKAGDRITWNRDGTVYVDGEKLRGTNITDILIDLASQRQEKVPLKGTPGPAKGLEKVGRVLKDTNVSRNLIKNLRRTEQVYGSPAAKEKLTLRVSPSPKKGEKQSFVSSFLNWSDR